MLLQLGISNKIYMLCLLSVGFEFSGCHCPADFKKASNVCIRVYTEQETAGDAAEVCQVAEPAGKLVIIDSVILAELSGTNSLLENQMYFIGPFPPCGALCYAIQYNNTQSAWQVVGISCGSVIHFICQTDFFYENPPDIDPTSVQYQLSSFSITVEWQAPPAINLTGFQFVAEEISSTMVKVDLDDVTTNTTLSGLCGGKEYTFHLYSVNGNVLSQPITFSGYTYPTPVECVNVTHSMNHVTFTWFAVNGAVTFYEAFLLEVDKMKIKSKGVYLEGMDIMDLKLSKGLINSKRHDLIIETVLVLASGEIKSIYQLPLNPDDVLIEESFCNVTSSSPSSSSACGTIASPDEVTTSRLSSASPHCPSFETYLTMPAITNTYHSTPKQMLSTPSPTQQSSTNLKNMISTNPMLITSGSWETLATSTPSTDEETSPSERRNFMTSWTIAFATSTLTDMATEEDFVARTTLETLELTESSTDKLSTTQPILVGENDPTISAQRTTDLRLTQAETTLTYHSKETSENLADPVTTDTGSFQTEMATIPVDDNPFVNCSFSSQLDSTSENLTIAATKYIQHVLSGILPSDSLTKEPNSTTSEDNVEGCSLPEKNESTLTVGVLADYLTDELLRLTSDDLTINIDDQPGIKDFKLIVNPLTLPDIEEKNLTVEFNSGIEIEVPFSTLNQSDCCKAILLYEEDEESLTSPSSDNICTHNNSQECSQVPRPFHIVTISLYPPSPVDLFSEPIQLKFYHQRSVTTDLQAKLDLVPTCVWLDEDLSMETKLVWKTDNIITERQPEDEPYTGSDVKVVKCISYHLTSFSVIMRPAELKLHENHYRALSIISMVGSIITIISAVVTIAVFIFLGILQYQRIVHSNLITAIGLSHLVFIIGIDKVQNKIFCSLVSVLLFYFLLATFCWMLMEATYLYVSVVQVFARDLKVIKYTLIGWGLPMLIVCVTVGSSFHHLTSDMYCWLPVEGNKILAFVIPSFVIIVVNLLLLFAVLYEINKMVKRNITDVKISRTRTTAKALLLMLPLVGTPWIFALFALNSNLVIFDYLFNIFNSFQGLWIFLLHVVGNKEVRTRLRAKVSPQSTRNDWATQSTKSQTPSENLPMTKMYSL